MTPLCKRNTSQQFHSGMLVSVKKKMPYPTTPINPHGRALKTFVLQIDFLCYKQNTFERARTVGNPQQPCCIQDTSRDRGTHYFVFLLKLGACPMKGLAFFHCSSISIASEKNLCRERRDWHSFYNRANCLRLPHSLKCLLCCFTTQQETKGQRGPTAEQRCHSSIHLKPRFQWETTAFQFFSSSSKRQTPGSKLTLQQFFQSGFIS